ncbi:zinc finger protein 302-like [Anabrus simplex]|uniref:zinc finger protein 302-like n=1 Tax=Anabrus simplex TaxID=316456 RepID=UPI0035A3516F
MPGCCAFGCTNRPEKGFLMKVFPRDPVRRKQWAAMVKREGWSPTDASCLCEAHFEPHMWEKVREDGKRVLKCNAVPTIFSHREPPERRKPPITWKPCSSRKNKYARREETTPSSNLPDTAVTDLNIMEKPEFISYEREWLPGTEESSTYEIWIKSDPADEGTIKIEKDVTTMLIPKAESEISSSGSYENFEKDASRGIKDEFDDVSASPKNEMSLPPLNASANLPVDCKENFRSEPYSCAECKITFKQCETMEKHKLIHSQVKPYSCLHCNQTFFLWDHLIRHLKEHRITIRFSCKVCNKSFSRKIGLKEHMASHSLIKLFSCTVCGSRFACRSSMYRHMSIHAEDEKKPCPVCGKKFVERGMKIHRVLSHSGEKS